MTAPALALVLVAAFVHACWNVQVRHALDPRAFLWCATLATCLVFGPAGLRLAVSHPVPQAAWGILVLTSVFETGYFWLLGSAYRAGDLSLVYPVARAVSPILTPLLGVFLLGERFSGIAVLGVVFIVAGVLCVHLAGFSLAAVAALGQAFRQPATRYALAAGVCTAAYSALDKVGVSLVFAPLYTYLVYLGSTIGFGCLLLPHHAAAVRDEWRQHHRRVLGVGVLGPVAYGLALLALTFTPVSYVGPAREVSVVMAALLGRVLLGEPYGPQRLAGSLLISVGVMCLALG